MIYCQAKLLLNLLPSAFLVAVSDRRGPNVYSHSYPENIITRSIFHTESQISVDFLKMRFYLAVFLFFSEPEYALVTTYKYSG